MCGGSSGDVDQTTIKANAHMTPIDRILLAKAAADTGWDIPTEPEDEWLCCASVRFDSRAWVSRDPTGPCRLAVSS